MLSLLLSALLLGPFARAEEFNLKTGPRSGQQAILRIQREGSRFTLYRCLAKSMNPDDIDESRCEEFGQTSPEALAKVAAKFDAGQPLLPEEKHGILMLVVMTPIVKYGMIGTMTVVMAPAVFVSQYGYAAYRKVLLMGIPMGILAVTGYAGYLAYNTYYQTDGKRLLTQDVLLGLGESLEKKVPDGQEYVQALPAELWFYFEPRLFR